MKKHLTNDEQGQALYVIEGNVVYAIPRDIASRYIVDAKPAVSRPGNVSSDEIFAKLNKKTSKAASLLRGLRTREDLSQTAFAKRIKVSQANLSKMENGSRPIGKIIAKRIAKEFNVDYRYFVSET